MLVLQLLASHTTLLHLENDFMREKEWLMSRRKPEVRYTLQLIMNDVRLTAAANNAVVYSDLLDSYF